MKQGCLLAAALGAGLVAVVIGALVFLASRAKPLPPIGSLLATLPGPERTALESVCRLSGIAPESLRVVGFPDGRIFRDARNRASLVVKDGRLRALCLAGATFERTPDLAPFTALEALWLEDGTLPAWPELSALTSLTELQLRGQPLGTPAAGGLPPSLRVLGLSRTKVSDVTPLASLSKLTELDLSGTPVTDFSPLLPLALEKLDLSRSQVAAPPLALPRKGSWSVDLAETPATNPPGFSWKGPGSYSVSGSPLGNATRRGSVQASKVDASGTGEYVVGMTPVDLPTARGTSLSVGPVILEATVQTGRARVWLQEPPGVFSNPWFGSGKIAGFGFARRVGWVYADFGAGETARLRGRLSLPGPVENHDYRFLIEPLDGTRATGLRYRVVSAEPEG